MPTVRLVITTAKRLAPVVSEVLFGAGAQGLEERTVPARRGRATTLIAYAETRRELAAIWRRSEKIFRAMLPAALLPQHTLEVDEAETWRTAWMAHMRPIQLTARIVLAPTTVLAPPLGRAQQLLLYQPALAFGDGDHPTTRLAARAIEQHYRRAPGGALLDVGAGTGVLSLVAIASGARRALGTDIDAQAVQAAQTNAAINSMSRSARFVGPRARVSGDFDLVAVNIELRPLLEVLAHLPAAARRASKIVVTGFLKWQVAPVRSALKSAGFAPRRGASEGEWCLLVGENSG